MEVTVPRTRLSTRATILASLAIGVAPTAWAASFPAVVRTILDNQTDGRLAKMDTDQRARMTDCVIAALAGLPSGKKRFVVEGANLDEQEHRFGVVVQEDRAKWKQKIAAACSRIALDQTRGND